MQSLGGDRAPVRRTSRGARAAARAPRVASGSAAPGCVVTDRSSSGLLRRTGWPTSLPGGGPDPCLELAEDGDDLAEDAAVGHLEGLQGGVLRDRASRGRRRGRGASRWPRPRPARAAAPRRCRRRGRDPGSGSPRRRRRRCPAPIMESPATLQREMVGVAGEASGTARWSSTCSAARTGAPAAIRPTSGTVTAPRPGLGQGHRPRLRRVLVSRPLRSRFASCAWTLDEDVRPDGLADLANGGGVAPLPNRLGDEVEDPLLALGGRRRVRHGR